MSFELRTLYKRSLENFLGRFSDNNIWFVVYPFFKVFKLCCFCPVQVSVDNYSELVFHQDLISLFFTLFCFLVFSVGFAHGVHVLSRLESLGFHGNNTIISYITNWAQVFSLFVLGCVAIITSWTNLSNMKNLITRISNIDYSLEMIGVTISYRVLRKRLFIQTAISLVIPTCLSMVNCIMINSTFNITSACYWFICFTPMLLLTLKELQFYNLMFLLKGKFNIINKQIKFLCDTRFPRNCSLNKRITKHSSEDSKEILIEQNESKLIEEMRSLGEIYSDVADCVDEVLNIFASHLLMTTCVSFGVITIQSYNVFALIMHSLVMQIHEILFTVAWIIVQIMVVAVNVIACTQTSNAMGETGKFLHRLKPKGDCLMFLQMVQVFSMEVLHRQKALTAAGFFDMNYKLFTSIVAAVTTYLIIIIQFHLANVQLTPACAQNQTSF